LAGYIGLRGANPTCDWGTRSTREFESVLNQVAPHARMQIATLPDARRSPPKHPVGRISVAHPARGRSPGAPSLSARASVNPVAA